jgi:hypothetical protein
MAHPVNAIRILYYGSMEMTRIRFTIKTARKRVTLHYQFVTEASDNRFCGFNSKISDQESDTGICQVQQKKSTSAKD